MFVGDFFDFSLYIVILVYVSHYCRNGGCISLKRIPTLETNPEIEFIMNDTVFFIKNFRLSSCHSRPD